jgi:hypothetical protein
MEFIRSNLIKDRASATEVFEKDLPTNPLSHLILAQSCCQAADEATLAEMLAFINSVEVTRCGVTVLSLESEDLWALNAYLYRRPPIATNNITTATATRTIGLVIPFGRNIFDPAECHPATKKGDLTLRVNTTVIATAAITGIYSVEAVELIDAQPTHYLKSTKIALPAPGATGERDVELPTGNEIVAIGIRRTSGPAVTTHVYGVQNARLLVDNKEYGYASARAQCLDADWGLRAGGLPSNMLLQQQILPPMMFWMDFDPNGDGKWLVDTKGKSSVKLRLDMGVNEAVWLTLVERVAV